MSERKKIHTVSVFIRLGLHRPHAIDHKTKLERIRTKKDPRTAVVFAEYRGSVFLNKN